jgi:hypothetical protein
MRKMLLVLMTLILVMGFSLPVFAGNVPTTAAVADAEKGWILTTPFKTGVTGFWFPTDNTFAGGLNVTALSVRYISAENPTLSKISLDLDGTIAKEFNAANETLYGIGIKANYAKDMTSKTGLMFEPSIGATALRNLKGITGWPDIFRDYRFAIYGTVVLYKFQ